VLVGFIGAVLQGNARSGRPSPNAGQRNRRANRVATQFSSYQNVLGRSAIFPCRHKARRSSHACNAISGPKSVCCCPLLPISVNFDRHVNSEYFARSVARRVTRSMISNRSGLQNANEKRCAICPWRLVCQFLVARQRQMSDLACPAAFACPATTVG
jgi:hypothetical protein